MEQFTRRAVLQSGVAAICTSSLPVSRAICPARQPRSGLPALLPLHEPIWASCSRAFQPASSSNSRFDADFVTVAGRLQQSSSCWVIRPDWPRRHASSCSLPSGPNPTLPIQAVYLQDIGSGYEIVVPRMSAINRSPT